MRPTSRSLEAPHKWVRIAGFPETVELCGVPSRLVSDLGHANRMRGRTLRCADETVRSDGVKHVRLVVGTVEVDSVPAASFN